MMIKFQQKGIFQNTADVSGVSTHQATKGIYCVLFAAVFLLIFFTSANGGPGYAAQQHWADPFKQIPAGPFTLDVGGSLRLRYEYVDNYNRKQYGTGSDDGFLLQRFRIEAALSYADRLRAFVQLQDARVFGYSLDNRDFKSNPNQDVADIQQAFLEIKPLADVPLRLIAGRQTFGYGDDRIFGPGDWGNTGRVVWDAVKLSWQDDRFFVDAFYGRTLIHETYSLNFDHDREAAGAYSSFEIDPDTIIDFFYVFEFDTDKKTQGENNTFDRLHIHTVGSRFAGTKGGLDWDATYARQFGRWGGDKVEAWALHAGIGYTVPVRFKPRFGFDYCYASGDDDPYDGKHKTFEPTFGARDRHYGWMNLFSWRNLENYQFSLALEPHRRWKVIVDYHIFRLAQAEDAWYSTGPVYRRDPSGNSGKQVGREIDITVLYRVSSHVDVRAGYAHFFPGSYVKRTGTNGSADWFHVQWMYRF